MDRSAGLLVISRRHWKQPDIPMLVNAGNPPVPLLTYGSPNDVSDARLFSVNRADVLGMVVNRSKHASDVTLAPSMMILCAEVSEVNVLVPIMVHDGTLLKLSIPLTDTLVNPIGLDHTIGYGAIK